MTTGMAGSGLEATRRVVVVGGGIAGLVAAVYAARAGQPVLVLESVSDPGGRARTRESEDGFLFNLGAHALYRASVAADVLRELGVAPAGGAPPTDRALALYGDRLHALPTGFVSLLTTSLLRPGEKLEIARFLGRLPAFDCTRHDDKPVADTLDELLHGPRARAVVAALVRLSSYAHAPRQMSGGAALRQLARSLGGVRYLDGGWRSMIATLADEARKAGAEIRTAARVSAVDRDATGLVVRLANGERIDASAVVLATPPTEASALVDGGNDAHLSRVANDAVPVRAACLDLGLTRLPNPGAKFLLGIDEPLYFSVHSGAARLAPPGCAVLHVARYLAPDESPSREAVTVQLEGLVDRLQPGWRDCVATWSLARELPVASALSLASRGGSAGRAPIVHPRYADLCCAGDWAGHDGELADASFSSGRAAGIEAARAAARCTAA